ncbi:MAG: hypothetical protein AB8B89_08295 [Gammaproteobacteria bacterium]
MNSKHLIFLVVMAYCSTNIGVAENGRLDLDTQTEVDLLPGYKPCQGEKTEKQFNDINCQDKDVVESLSIKDDEVQHQVIEDDVKPEGNILKKSFKPLVN